MKAYSSSLDNDFLSFIDNTSGYFMPYYFGYESTESALYSGGNVDKLLDINFVILYTDKEVNGM